jgi:type IV pilus assembly protein PilQ
VDVPLSPVPKGTPEEPFVAPPPAGTQASRLEGVEVMEQGAETVVRILGDGEFAYQSFQLENPPRFVLDLDGAVKTEAGSSLQVGSPAVERVRMAQYRSVPDPVARVVFDLRADAQPWIGRDHDGLVVRFGDGSRATPIATIAAAEPAVIEPAAIARPERAPQASVEQPAPADDSLGSQMLAARVLEVEEVTEEVELPSRTAPPPPVELARVEPEPQRVARTALEPSRPEPVEVTRVAAASIEPEAVPNPPRLAEPLRPSPAAKPAPEPLPLDAPAENDQRTAPHADASVAAPAPSVAEQPVLVAEVAPGARPVITTVAQQPPPAAPAEPPPPPASLAEGITLQGPAPDEGQAPRFGVTTVVGEKQYFGAPISMSLKDADITEVLRSIARISGLNIVIQPGVSGPVTVELESVPWDQALEQILKINQLGMELEGNILRIAPVSRLAQEAEEQQRLQSAKSLSLPLTTVMRRISYASAQEIADILERGSSGTGLMSQRASVIVDERTNTLIIQELPAFMDQVISIIENLDIPEQQVMIEARIVETTKNWSRSLGFDWTVEGVADAAHGNTTGVEFPNNISGAADAPTATSGVNLLTGGANGFLNIGLGNILNTFELDVVLQAAEDEGLVNVISAPKVATLDNERASIQSGLQIPVQTVANNTVTVQFVNATLRLDVTPHITAEGTVLLEISIQKREPQQALAVVGAPSAPIATRDARTRVLVRDGGTAVIGGIYEVSTDEQQSRVPGLADIPILGHLFRNKNRNNTNEELLIFITPRIVHL